MRDFVAVGLGSNVFQWSAKTREVTKLTTSEDGDSPATSIAWDARGARLAVGYINGSFRIVDSETTKCLYSNEVTTLMRIGSMHWKPFGCPDVFAMGSRSHAVTIVDLRAPNVQQTLAGHIQEVTSGEAS